MATAEWQERALTEKWLEITSCDSSRDNFDPIRQFWYHCILRQWRGMCNPCLDRVGEVETPPRDALINIPVLLRDYAENVQRYGHGDVDIIVIGDRKSTRLN